MSGVCCVAVRTALCNVCACVLVVASGGPLETVVDGVTGLLLPPDASMWADSMFKLSQDPAFARRMGAAGILHVQSQFSLSVFAEELERSAWCGLYGDMPAE